MSKLDITFSLEFYNRIEVAHEQIQVDNALQSEGNKQYVLNLLNDEHSGVNLLLACYSEAFDMKEARGGKQLSGKDLIELGLSSSDKEEAKGLRKMRDGIAKLYDAKNEGHKEDFIDWVNEHDSFGYATIWDALRACFRQDTKKKANPKPTDLKAFAIKVMEGIANRKFDNDEQFDTKELEEIAILIGLEVMPKEVFQTAKKMQAKENQKKKKVA